MLQSQKTDLEKRVDFLTCQLAWLTGVMHGVIARPTTPEEIRDTLKKALMVIGADKWPATSDPTNSKS
jgi:hypothetical protein